MFPISPNDPTVPAYNSIRRQCMLDMLNGSLGPVSLFQAGKWLSKASPTIVIMVIPRTKFCWSNLVASIKDLTRTNKFTRRTHTGHVDEASFMYKDNNESPF